MPRKNFISTTIACLSVQFVCYYCCCAGAGEELKGEIVPNFMDAAPNELLNVSYPSDMAENGGNKKTPNQMKGQPNLEWTTDPSDYTLLDSAAGPQKRPPRMSFPQAPLPRMIRNPKQPLPQITTTPNATTLNVTMPNNTTRNVTTSNVRTANITKFKVTTLNATTPNATSPNNRYRMASKTPYLGEKQISRTLTLVLVTITINSMYVH